MRLARRAAAAVLILASLGSAATPARGESPAPAARGETPAPVAPGFRVRALDGAWIELDRLRRDGPVLIDFWATWCKPCVAALPEIEALHRRLGPRGLTVLGVSVDGPRNHARVRPFANRLGLTFPLVLDGDGDLQQRFQVRAVPTTVLVDRSGAIVHVRQGWRPGETEALERAAEALLPATPGGDAETPPETPADSSAGGRPR
jgi:peroxiredoxin